MGRYNKGKNLEESKRSFPDWEPIIKRALLLGKKYRFNRRHALSVARQSLLLFDELGALHRLSHDKRPYLQVAALLHDIGWLQGDKAHHKASRDIILTELARALAENELIVVALIARYHRKSLPDKRHRYYGELAAPDKETVNKLSVILRIADGLDRVNSELKSFPACRQVGGKVIIKVSQSTATGKNKEIKPDKLAPFVEVFGKKVVISRSIAA